MPIISLLNILDPASISHSDNWDKFSSQTSSCQKKPPCPQIFLAPRMIISSFISSSWRGVKLPVGLEFNGVDIFWTNFFITSNTWMDLFTIGIADFISSWLIRYFGSLFYLMASLTDCIANPGNWNVKFVNVYDQKWLNINYKYLSSADFFSCWLFFIKLQNIWLSSLLYIWTISYEYEIPRKDALELYLDKSSYLNDLILNCSFRDIDSLCQTLRSISWKEEILLSHYSLVI